MSVKPRFDVIAIGDSTLDVFLQIHEATVACQLKKEQCLLCLEYAQKIPIEGVIKIPGAGNASNVAVASRRLGFKSAIVSIIGRDETGDQIMSGWKNNSVATNHVQRDAKHETNYSTVLNFQGERTILVYNQPRTYRLPRLETTRWIYYTALGHKHEKLERELLAHLKHEPTLRLAFNPGTLQLQRGLAALKPLVARCELFVVNKEEAQRLLEDGNRPMQNLLSSFLHLGAKNVVITDGAAGSYAANETAMWHCPIFPGQAIERTGAGDSYAASVMCAFLRDVPLPEAMRHGTANSWSVVQKIGPQAGLLSATSLQRVLKKFQHIQAKKI